MSHGISKALVVGGALTLLAAGCVVLFVALIVTSFSCDDAEEHCRLWSLGVLQLVVALLALVPLGGLVRAILQNRDSAVGWLLASIAAYCLWAGLAAGHL